jgi:hypothetical protein
LGWLDAGEATEVAQKYDIRGFPTIMTFGQDKSKPDTYKGGREEAALVDHVTSESAGFVSMSDMDTLTYKKMYGFLDNPASVLLLGKEEPPGWYSALAGDFTEKKLTFGFVPGTTDGNKIKARFNIKKGKGGLFFFSKKLETFVQLKGGIKAEAAKKFVASAFKAAKKKEKFEQVGKAGKTPRFPPPEVPRKKNPTSLTQLTKKNQKSKCWELKGKKNICMLILLAADASYGDYEASLKKMSKKYRNDPVSFVWVSDDEGGANIRETLGIEEATTHAVCFKTGKRNRYAIAEMASGKSSKVAMNFVDNVLGGGANFKVIKNLPAL